MIFFIQSNSVIQNDPSNPNVTALSLPVLAVTHLVLFRNLSNFCSFESVLTMFFGSSFPVFPVPEFVSVDKSAMGAVAPGSKVCV